MPRLMPHNSVVALAVPPVVWMSYFVASFLVSELGCNRGWEQLSVAGFSLLNLLLWMIALVSVALLSYAAWEAWLNRRATRDQDDPEIAERRAFLATAGFFLCGVSLLGTLWGALNMIVFTGCGG